MAASAHIPNADYAAVVQKALEMPGFSHEPEPKFVTVGFGHQTTLGAAGGGTLSVVLLRRLLASSYRLGCGGSLEVVAVA